MDGTELWLASDLPYPITISSLDSPAASEVVRGTRLLTYSFAYTSSITGISETRFGTWDSTLDGVLDSWKIKQGDIITQPRAVVVINEPCKHPVQISGLCAVCGKDMTEASIQMTHSGKGPTVSLEEAQRLERETATHLLQKRKLSLIVDLDQTIVHATVDPTVGEWITEGEAWETRNRTHLLDSQDDVVNPNWEALKDVSKFTLGPELTFPPLRNASGSKMTVPGPGLQDFLTKVNEKYEMHVYTMGTRAYAEAVCAAIDPDGSFFGDRILSRDESGSLTQKSLQRLFPCDTSMVVIIDDRADVWEWSPNLLKVRAYDFFVGIGDINSTLLPKVPSLVPSPATTPLTCTPVSSENDVEPTAKEAAAVLATQNKITNERIAAQVEERPLAKKQVLLEEEDSGKEDSNATAINGMKKEENDTKNEKHNHHHHHRKALLKNDDTELTRVGDLLENVHKRFYDAYDARLPDSEVKMRKIFLVDGKLPEKAPYDVRIIIPRIRKETLAGTHIVFSSVIPLNVEASTSEIWRTAEVFGATCHTSLTPEVTHVVAAKRGTAKVDLARRRGNIHVVWLPWFLDSLALWERQDESSYLIDPDDSTQQQSSTPLQIHVSPPEEEEREEFPIEEPGAEVDFDADIWADANAEVDEVLGEETEDDELRSNFNIDEDAGDDGWRSDASNSSSIISAYRGKKRSRSSSVSLSAKNDDTGSPLSKRKKLAEARTSRLKIGHVASPRIRSGEVSREGSVRGDGEDEVAADVDEAEENSRDNESTTSTDGDSLDDVFDADDDFLARELEAEEEDGG
ncbi:hypothetical protein Clacol_003679 [Clathrus columnatus]|uniref:RNA polymerase II subunit A C-terminal domain phosphatase n=1 Tax=Clathrus columnatus TaxID=1419009 RepID=A0AAV5AAB2_9AGAM|nr:hypothetical protein Clacol_003679 [Clathrus columnatus]